MDLFYTYRYYDQDTTSKIKKGVDDEDRSK